MAGGYWLASVGLRDADTPGNLKGSGAASSTGAPRGGGPAQFHPGGFIVPAGQTMRIDGVVETDGNVIVEGTLIMRAGSTLRFVDVDESAFEGGGLDPIDTDVGLWVMGAGVLDAQGTAKAAWNREGDDPSWSNDDELVLAPTAAGETSFTPFVRGGVVPRAHPSVPPAEVLNLSRDCSIEGTSAGRSHVFIRSTSPQIVRHVGLRQMGPRKDGLKIAGRWPLHFHHNMHSQHGVVVEGVVVRDAGSHAFVLHNSDGITLRQCIAYDVQEDAFWWDPDTVEPKSGEPAVNFTDGSLYDRCVAALVRVGDEGDSQRLCGFNLGKGLVAGSNRAIDSVGVGVQGGKNCAGFGWQEGHQGAPWVFKGCVSHNNAQHGLFTWLNLDPVPHVIENFTAYRNPAAGLAIGAYGADWEFHDATLVENGQCGVLQHARSLDLLNRIRYDRPVVIGSPVAFQEGDINFPDHPAVVVTAAQVTSCPVVVDETADPSTTFEFVD